jgi:hypothetical protein
VNGDQGDPRNPLRTGRSKIIRGTNNTAAAASKSKPRLTTKIARFYATVNNCIIAIMDHQKRERNPRASRFHVKFREMFEATNNYLVRLELEFLSRCTKVKCDQPTLATVLVASDHVSFRLAPE